MLPQLSRVISTFKEEKGFDRLFSLFYEKYRSYERVEKGISVELTNPTLKEKEAIGGLLGEDLSKRKTIKITASKFEKALKKTKYGVIIRELPFQKLLELYMGGELKSKKEEQREFEEEKNHFFNGYKSDKHPSELKDILSWVEQDENKNNRYYLQYRQDKSALKKHLDIISSLFSLFPLEEPMYLPIFAAKVTKNPHAFDINEDAGKFLVYTLQILKEIQTGEKVKTGLNAEETARLLFEYNILRDDLYNYVTIYNIEGENNSGEKNLLLEGLCKEKAVINLPLKEILNLKRIKAKNNRIYMVENSSVASFIVSKAKKEKRDVSIVSGNGMLNIATLKFLDKFTKQGGEVYYAGDYDPEGLLIANQLLKRYNKQVLLWSMSKEEYILSLSDEKITLGSLSKLLNRYEDNQLDEIKMEMKQVKKAGYQENILERLFEKME